VRPVALVMVVGALLAVVSRGFTLLTPMLGGRLVDAANSGADASALNTTGTYLFLVVIGAAIGQFGAAMAFAYVGERIVLAVRRDIFSHVLTLSLDFFETRKVGELISRVAADAAVMREIGTSVPLNTVTHGITLIGVIGIIVTSQAQFALILFAFLPIMAGSTFFFGRVVRGLAIEAQDSLAQTNATVAEAVTGIETVKAFVQEDREATRYDGWLGRTFRAAMRLTLARETMKLVSYTILFGGLAVVTWYATTLIAQGALTAGELITFMLYGLIAGNSFGALAAVWANWERLRGVALRLVEILHTRPTVVDRPGALAFDGTHEQIAFEGVRFAYPSDAERTVLSDLSFSFGRGQHIAIVGESGAGKSTIAALLLRLYDVTEGAITIDGRDLRDLVRDDLRKAIAVVPQDVVVFGRSVRENIMYGREDATEEEVVAAARAAHALEFIRQMPAGFDTVLGERGQTVSGGQRQRIAIARALLKDPPILILDEATSALDKPSEIAVRDALRVLMKDRTTIVIAHRLATIESADRVLVLHEGKLVESGSPSDLLGADGHYARLHRTGAWQEGQVA